MIPQSFNCIAARADAYSARNAPALSHDEKEPAIPVNDGYQSSPPEAGCPDTYGEHASGAPSRKDLREAFSGEKSLRSSDSVRSEESGTVAEAACPETASASGTLPEMSDILRKEKSAAEVGSANLSGMGKRFSGKGPRSFSKEDVGHYYLHGEDHGTAGLSSEGLRLYKTVKTRYCDKVQKCAHGTPSIYLTGGLPGSGKTALVSSALSWQSEYVSVDPDLIKKDIIRDLAAMNPAMKEEMVSNPLWATVIHRTSEAMARRLVYDALKTGRDILFDSSMATSEVDKYRNIAAEARKRGYKVYGILTRVDVKTSIQRAELRAQQPTQIIIGNQDRGTSEILSFPGRLTTPSYVRSCNRHYERNLRTYIDEGLYDRFMILDNNGAEPILFATSITHRNSDN